MKSFVLMLAANAVSICVTAQYSYKVQIKDAVTQAPLAGSTAIRIIINKGSIADSNGIATLANIPEGKQVIAYRSVGYRESRDTLTFPLPDASLHIVLLQPDGDSKMEEVTVSAIRSSRTISDVPTRVETISSGELNEKVTMQPANVKMILTESTGIQTQQTSAASANTSIRIQGLDGKYTQLLKDGFPLYSGFSGGLSLVQIPPLDLKRVEVIKGASSTLYGGGAIAGLINFVTKEPTAKRELSFLVNANFSKAADLSGFYAQRFGKTGITIFASQNVQAAYDADKDGLSDIPKFTRYNFNPKFFYYISNTATLSFGINSSFENRLGGDMQVINKTADSLHSYFEKNISDRISSQLKFEKKLADKSVLTFKNSVAYFGRRIGEADYLFSGKQLSSYSELNYLFGKNRSEWIVGGNFWTDDFRQVNTTLYPLTNNLTTAGVFAQNSLKATSKFIVESGLRMDATNHNNFFFLPKLSLLYKINPKLTTRLGGGLGYKAPTIFSEEAEEKGFRNIQPLNVYKAQPERSTGANCDINYRASLPGNVSFSVNQMFFFTRVYKPLVLSDSALPNGNYEFANADGYLDSKGFETNLKLKYKDVSLYLGYTFVDAKRHFNSVETVNPLTAKNRIYITLTYEIESRLQAGYELFYTGQQQLSDGEKRPGYWIMGASVQYNFKNISVFVNAENFTDRRQTRYERIYTGTLQNPQFKEIWAPTDGFLFNTGFKLSL